MSLRAKCAIAGLGATRMGRNFDHSSAIGFAVETVELALADAGIANAVACVVADAPLKPLRPV